MKTKAQIRAQSAVQKALKKGKLVRPDHCSYCRRECKPYAHHEDYNKPLDVIWVCPSCHKIHWHPSQRQQKYNERQRARRRKTT